MARISTLTREQKEAISLLQIGTFLEFFDLYLYVHLAVLLNEIFFPKFDPHTAALASAAAFCSTYVFRPIGALIFGRIGDQIGRKATIIITTTMMAVSCLIMANLPTYAEIGITAAWLMIICRILQSLSSMGEVVGAEVYLTEAIQRPARFPAVAFIEVSANLGAMLALGIAFFVTASGLNWRLAFWAGATIAIVGALARKRLRETPDFLEMKRQWLRKGIEVMNVEQDPVRGADYNAKWKEPIRPKTLASYFFISCGWPLCMYIIYFYFNPMLKEKFGYAPEDIIKHNFFLITFSTFVNCIVTYLCYHIHPLKINKVRGALGFVIMILIPFIVPNFTSSMQLFVIQALLLITPLNDMPSVAVFLRNFPLYRRVTFASILWSLSRALMFVITSFGVIYLGDYFGIYGLWIIVAPTGIGFLYGINHFKDLEAKNHLYPNLS